MLLRRLLSLTARLAARPAASEIILWIAICTNITWGKMINAILSAFESFKIVTPYSNMSKFWEQHCFCQTIKF